MLKVLEANETYRATFPGGNIKDRSGSSPWLEYAHIPYLIAE